VAGLQPCRRGVVTPSGAVGRPARAREDTKIVGQLRAVVLRCASRRPRARSGDRPEPGGCKNMTDTRPDGVRAEGRSGAAPTPPTSPGRFAPGFAPKGSAQGVSALGARPLGHAASGSPRGGPWPCADTPLIRKMAGWSAKADHRPQAQPLSNYACLQVLEMGRRNQTCWTS